MSKEETPILPQAAAFLVISYLVYRFFFTSSSTTSTPSNVASRRAVDPQRLQQQVEVVRGMFPQFSAAAVEAELMRNGGSIEATTERILSTGFLPEPPQPPAPTRPSASSSSSSATRSAGTPSVPANSRPRPAAGAGASSSSPTVTAGYTDLITRYNLHSRLNEPVDEETEEKSRGKGKAPAGKMDRHMAHKAKRDEMILAARRRLERMIEAEKASGKGQ